MASITLTASLKWPYSIPVKWSSGEHIEESCTENHRCNLALCGNRSWIHPGWIGNFLAAFATLSGAIALAVGLASQNLLSNFVAGIFILKDRPFEIGNWIEWSDKAGTVENIDLRVTRIRTFNSKRITVLNSELADSAVTNVVAHYEHREAVPFGIGYDDIAEATTSILEADQHKQILDDPVPEVRVTELADSYVGLQARIWIEDPSHADFSEVRSEFITAVKRRFDAEMITIPYLHRQLTGGLSVVDAQSVEPTTSVND